MKVTVFGATGGIGGEVVSQLLDAGHEVTAVLREGRPYAERRARFAVVPGLDDPGPLAGAILGADAVVSAVGPRSLRDGPVASTATKAILRAMKEAGVRRFIAVSAMPVSASRPGDGALLRFLLQPLIRSVFCDHYLDLARMEGAIESSTPEWTVVRPPRLSSGPVTGRYRTRVDGNVPRGYVISRADVAHAMIAALADPATMGRAIGVAN